ncbi:MAG: squalene/phytoene synthase family protein, partial [Chloroflexota bacterium]|nr:squalene/phytoene synthase family protein [Chloroflexota bacterium]
MAFDVLAELEAHGGEHYTPEEAYAWCRAYTKDRASNFYYAFTILPADKRNAIYAAYAFSGYVDDIADELTDRRRQDHEIALARQRLATCYAGGRRGPLFVALGDAVDRFGIPQPYFEELINGVEMDFTIDRYGTWADLQLYCYRVASIVGQI